MGTESSATRFIDAVVERDHRIDELERERDRRIGELQREADTARERLVAETEGFERERQEQLVRSALGTTERSNGATSRN